MPTNRNRKKGELPDGEGRARLRDFAVFFAVPFATWLAVLWLLGSSATDAPGGILGGIGIAFIVGTVWGATLRLWHRARHRANSEDPS